MFSLKADNIYDVAKPLHFCSRMFGLTSFVVTREKGKLKLSVNALSIFCLLLSIMWSWMFFAMSYSIQEELTKYKKVWASEIFQKGIYGVTFGFILIFNLTSCWTVLSQRHFAKLLNLIVELDEELLMIKHPLNLVHHKRIVLIPLVAIKLFTIFIFLSIATHQKANNYSFTYLAICYSTVMHLQLNIIIIFHFLFWMWAVKLRYQKLNIYLNDKSFNENSNLVNEKLNIAAMLHDKLVDISELINRCYGVPVRCSLFI